MLSQFPRNTRHVLWSPREDVPILTEELDELAFLFRVQARADYSDAVRVSFVQPDLLRVLVRLEGGLGALPRCIFQVLLGEVNLALDFLELLCDDQSLGQLRAVLGAVDGALEVPGYGDDPLRSRHLHLQVGVVRHHHELGQNRMPQESVVRAA